MSCIIYGYWVVVLGRAELIDGWRMSELQLVFSVAVFSALCCWLHDRRPVQPLKPWSHHTNWSKMNWDLCVYHYPVLVTKKQTMDVHIPFLGRLFDYVDLIKPVSNVRPCVRASVRPSVHKKFYFNEIWHVGRGWWVMHEGMQCDPTQGQGHKPFKVGNPAVFKSYFLLGHLQWELATDHWFLN